MGRDGVSGALFDGSLPWVLSLPFVVLRQMYANNRKFTQLFVGGPVGVLSPVVVQATGEISARTSTTILVVNRLDILEK